MTDDFEDLVVSVRAETTGFARDMQAMKREFDTTLLGGFDQAGKLLEKSLLGALQNGKMGFEDLKRVALSAFEEIASKVLTAGLDTLFGSIGGGGGGGAGGGGWAQFASMFTEAVGSMFGLPGRATGGLVGPNKPYLVGENGPELFVPTTSGHVESNRSLGGTRNDVRVAINLATSRGTSAPAALQRSSRQVASAVRRALSN